MPPTLVSLFSGAGFADLGSVHGCGARLVAACELRPERAWLLRQLHPGARVFCADVSACGGELVEHVLGSVGAPDVLFMSPPCQGMSTSSMGTIQCAVRRKRRAETDARNSLVLVGLDEVAARLRPRWIIIENVPRMLEMLVPVGQSHQPIGELIEQWCAASAYELQHRVVCASEWGVPQLRRRLIMVMRRRDEHREAAVSFLPAPQVDSPPVTLRQAIAHLPVLDGLGRPCDEHDALHRVPRLPAAQHSCIKHTAEGGSAFDNNTCVGCGDASTTSREVVVCPACGRPLPKPQRAGAAPRRVRCFSNGYCRMRLDAPAPTVTTNGNRASSSRSIHPLQHRVLSCREILILSTLVNRPRAEHAEKLSIDELPWHQAVERACAALVAERGAERACRLLREVVGECVPALMMRRIVEHVLCIDEGGGAHTAVLGARLHTGRH